MKGFWHQFSWWSHGYFFFFFFWRSWNLQWLYSEYQHKETYSLKNQPQRSPQRSTELVVTSVFGWAKYICSLWLVPLPPILGQSLSNMGLQQMAQDVPSPIPAAVSFMSDDENFQGYGWDGHLNSICSSLISEQLTIYLRTVVSLYLVSFPPLSPGKVSFLCLWEGRGSEWLP